MVPKPLRAVFFDHDDTLVETLPSKVEEHIYVAREYYGRTLTEEQVLAHWGKPLPELVCILCGTRDSEEALAYHRRCHTRFPKVLFPGANPLLEWLHSQGILAGIVTSTIRFSLDHDLRTSGIRSDLIAYTQAAGDSESHKPDPTVFDPAIAFLAQHGIEPGQMLYVGDNRADMLAAYGAGIGFIGVETGLVSADQFRKYGAVSVPDLVQLRSLLADPDSARVQQPRRRRAAAG